MAESDKSPKAGDESKTAAKPADKLTAKETPIDNTNHKPVPFGGKYEIQVGNPLPELDEGRGTAYDVKVVGGFHDKVFAHVIRSKIPVRMDIIRAINKMEGVALLQITDIGVVYWPPDKCERFVIFIEMPLGASTMQSLERTIEPFQANNLVRQVLAPMLMTLKELALKDIFHGDIRPTNIFMNESGSKSAILGTCVLGPPGVYQPVIFETIERGMSDPVGKGEGFIEEDLYALGVTCAFLLHGHNPMAGMTDREIIQEKIEKGSFRALLSKARMPASLAELLRGLLADDRKQQWTLNDIGLWLEGQRLGQKQVGIVKIPSRHYEFNEKNYHSLRLLAQALSEDVPTAVAQIEEGALDRWIRRSVNDELAAERVISSRKSAAGIGKQASYNDRLVARVCTGMDPLGPLHFKDIHIMARGIGYKLAAASVTSNQDVQTVMELINAGLGQHWYELQEGEKSVYSTEWQDLDEMSNYLSRTGLGYGMERILYSMSKSMSCISPMLQKFYVATPRDLLLTLDKIATLKDRPSMPFDRHIAAFLAVRERETAGKFLTIISSPHSASQFVIEILRMFAGVQIKYETGSLKGLATWFVSLLQPAAKRFYNLKLQEKVMEALEKSAVNGDLNILLDLVDNPEKIRKDRSYFLAALKQHARLNFEGKRLELKMQRKGKILRTLGQEVAVAIAALISILVVTVTLVFEFLL